MLASGAFSSVVAVTFLMSLVSCSGSLEALFLFTFSSDTDGDSGVASASGFSPSPSPSGIVSAAFDALGSTLLT